MCISLFRCGSSLVGGVLLVLVSACSWEVSNAATEEVMSTLLSDTVNHLIEKLKNENYVDNIEGASSFPQTRGGGGGYGHGGGYGGGGNGNGAITLDPVSIISLLALGAFLINNILQLLRANAGTGTGPGNGRSLEQGHLEALPFLHSTFAKNGLNSSDTPSFMDFFENVGSLYYLQPKKRNMCMKRVVCNYLNMKESREKSPTLLRTQIFDFMISTISKIVAPEINEDDKEQKCTKAQKYCSDALLKDARVSVEYKIYSQVSSWFTKLAFNGLASG